MLKSKASGSWFKIIFYTFVWAKQSNAIQSVRQVARHKFDFFYSVWYVEWPKKQCLFRPHFITSPETFNEDFIEVSTVFAADGFGKVSIVSRMKRNRYEPTLSKCNQLNFWKTQIYFLWLVRLHFLQSHYLQHSFLMFHALLIQYKFILLYLNVLSDIFQYVHLTIQAFCFSSNQLWNSPSLIWSLFEWLQLQKRSIRWRQSLVNEQPCLTYAIGS